MKIKIVTTLKDEYVKELLEHYGVNSMAEIRGALKAHFKQGGDSLYIHHDNIEKNNIDIECGPIEEMSMAAKEGAAAMNNLSEAMKSKIKNDEELARAKAEKSYSCEELKKFYRNKCKDLIDENAKLEMMVKSLDISNTDLSKENKQLKKKVKELEKKLSK